MAKEEDLEPQLVDKPEEYTLKRGGRVIQPPERFNPLSGTSALSRALWQYVTLIRSTSLIDPLLFYISIHSVYIYNPN